MFAAAPDETFMGSAEVTRFRREKTELGATLSEPAADVGVVPIGQRPL